MKFNWNEKQIGVYHEETKEFHKRVDPAKHFFWKFQGYGIDFNIISELPRETKVFIHAPGKTYETTIATYQDKGEIYERKGFGKQIILSTKNFI